MSLLQDLVQELQQRIEGQAAAPSTAAVADAAGSERINVTLPRGVMDDLKLKKMIFELNIARAGEACDATEPLSGGFVASS